MTSINNDDLTKVEFGDFQTPLSLAGDICKFLDFLEIQPRSILEPTCGVGNFLQGAMQTFSTSKKFVGFDVNNEYLVEFNQRTFSLPKSNIELYNSDFFHVDWQNILGSLAKPILILGNPPWVTNSTLGNINGTNLPRKSNFQGHKGIDALTGKSNFDISEWMIIRLLYLLQEYDGYMAMLCKTSVARKVLKHAWKNNYRLAKAAIYIIDAKKHFNVSVGACLLLCWTGNPPRTSKCNVYQGLSDNDKLASIGMRGSELLADMDAYKKWSRLDGIEHYKWRSGVKHDCAKVMEFRSEGNSLKNGLGEIYDLEEEYLYPIYKSSDISKNNLSYPKRWVLITQKNVKEKTDNIKEAAPKTWSYLIEHAVFLDNRKSAIYKKRPRFSIFGVGEYSFAPWKVAVSGLYKNLNFSVIPPHEGKPAMLDDTCYFISCKNGEEAELLAELLNSESSKMFIRSLVFFDSKRPITIDILRRIDLVALAEELGKKELLQRFITYPKKCRAETLQKSLF